MDGAKEGVARRLGRGDYGGGRRRLAGEMRTRWGYR